MFRQGRRGAKAVLFLLLTTSYLKIAHGECALAPRDISQLTKRNNTILSVMNDTLMNYTNNAETVITRGSDFALKSHLFKTYSLDSASYFTFVYMGKMLAINWTQATQKANVNTSFDGLTLDSYITQRFVQPVQSALQNLSEYYSFSVGIFRPNKTQFHYTGYTTDSAGNSILDTTCPAGVGFVWRFCTFLPINIAFFDHLSPQYANLATIMEKALDSYYRTISSLSDSFVRANMIDVGKRTDGSAFMILYVEVYFTNASYDTTTILTTTVLSDLNITYQEEGNSTSTLITFCAPNSTRINATIYPPITTSTTSTLSTPNYQTTITNTESTQSAVISTLSAASTNTEISTASPSTLLTQNLSSDLLTPPMPALPTVTSDSTNMSITELVALWPSTQLTESPFSYLITTLAGSANSTPQANPPSDLSFATTVEPVNTSSNLNSPINSLTIDGISLSTVINNSWTVTPGQNSISGITTLNFPSNNTMTIKVPSGMNSTGSLAPPTASTANNNSGGRTTFDSDPFFKVRVPVVTKIYNDDYLLRRKTGTIGPLTENIAFFVVTVPTIIGLLGLICFCLICWQVDCNSQAQKVTSNDQV